MTGIWISGMLVFMVMIQCANMTLLFMHNNFTGWGELLLFLCTTSYFWIVAI